MPEGFERIIMPHLNAAHNLARWLVRDRALAEDVVQETMLRALGYFGSFRGDNPRAWLLRILRNAAYDALAARSKHSATFATADAGLEIPDPAPDPETAFTQAQGQTKLNQALADLPTELRECLILRELEELSYKEISHITGAPIGTVMSRLFRARQLLFGDQQEEV